jgi:oligopeptide transport system permease protein
MLKNLGVWILAFVLLLSIAGPFLASHSYEEVHLNHVNESPSMNFIFGTDDLGRDLFVRTCYGIRISLLCGFLAAFVDLVIGTLFGTFAAFMGGKTDEWMVRCLDILYALPYLIVVMIVSLFLGDGILSIVFAIASFGWITMARLVRGQVLSLKKNQYVISSIAMGGSFWHILRWHFLPNIKETLLVTLALTIPNAIFAEAYLSFLGLGIKAPLASLGTMTNEGLYALNYYPWRFIIPAFSIIFIMFGFNMVAEGLKKSGFYGFKTQPIKRCEYLDQPSREETA